MNKSQLGAPVNRLLKIICVLVMVSGVGATAAAQTPMKCDSSGHWEMTGGEPVLVGALCGDSGAEDFYRIDFGNKKSGFAPHIPGAGDLRYLEHVGDLLMYADATDIYAVDREHFKVVWHRPWKNAQRLDEDRYDDEYYPDGKHWAYLSDAEDGKLFHIISIDKGGIVEELTSKIGEDFIGISWQIENLVVFESRRMHIFNRPSGSREWKQADVESFKSPLVEGDYRVDTHGVMVLDREDKRLMYYRFATNDWTRAAINATAAIHGLGTNPQYALGVTNDASTVRVIARTGNYDAALVNPPDKMPAADGAAADTAGPDIPRVGKLLRNRYEAKYWKLPQNPRDIAVIGDGRWIALDGGGDNRAQIIDISEMTWKRRSLISYPAPGKIGEFYARELITVHPEYEETVIIWKALSGEKKAVLTQKDLTDAGFGEIESVETIREIPRYKLITGTDGRFVLFDEISGKLSIVAAAEKSALRHYPDNLRIIKRNDTDREYAYIVLPNGENGWIFYGDETDESKRIQKYNITAEETSNIAELQTSKEKWYGYCIDAEDCFRPTLNPAVQNRVIPDVAQSACDSHEPGVFAWAISILSFLAMIAVMLWRRGFGRKSHLVVKEDRDDGMALTDFYDDKNRRFISDRDTHLFLSPKITATPSFRIILSVLLGIGVGVAVAVSYFYDDTLMTFLSWVVVLALPVSAVTWVATSWMYWNRYYLLRFGNIMEGSWRNCAKTNQSIGYAPDEKTSYELSRNQWQQVDFVPLIIFDPVRPQFAIQYTGECSHTISPPGGKISDHPKPACTFDMARLSLVLLGLAATIVCTQFLFNQAYPDPLSAWTLDKIAAEVGDEGERTFTVACLEHCGDDESCHEQCHRRQLVNILNRVDAGINYDIEMTPAQFMQKHRDDVAEAHRLLENTEVSCSEKSGKLLTIPLWTDGLITEFSRVYSHADTFKAAELAPIADSIRADGNLFRALCDQDGICSKSADQCPEPPACKGNIVNLKSAICAFQKALGDDLNKADEQ